MLRAAVSAARLVVSGAARPISPTFSLLRDARGRLSIGSSHRLLVTASGSAPVSSGLDLEADLRSALAHEKIDLSSLDEDTSTALKTLWADRACRTKLRGELANFTRAKIDWKDLEDAYKNAEKQKQDGKTAVRDYVKNEASLTPGAAGAVSRYVYHQIQVSRVSPFMRALGEFPRHIYHGAALSPDLAPWMPEKLVKTIKDVHMAYVNQKLVHPEIDLFNALETAWDEAAFQHVMGKLIKRRVWWSPARLQELARLLHVARLLRDKRSVAVDRPSRIWLSGPKQGKTHFMRDCAMTIALLHPEALVGYCQYNQCQLTPQQVWQLQGSHVPQGDVAFDAFSLDLYHKYGMTPFFFSDELEFLYEQRITEPLRQLQELGESTFAVSIVTGTVAQLAHMISSTYRPPEYNGLPELNHNKHSAKHLPPLLSWTEAQDLAKTVAAERWSAAKLQSKAGSQELRSLCWQFAGSLGAMVAHLQGSDTAEYAAAPPLEGSAFSASNVIIGLVSREAEARNIALGDAFALPSFTKERAIYELEQFRAGELQQPDGGDSAGKSVAQWELLRDSRMKRHERAFLELQNKCIIVPVGDEFRLVHPVHVEWFRKQLMASGFTYAHLHDFMATGRKGERAEEVMISGLAAHRGVGIKSVSLTELRAVLQRLQSDSAVTPEDEEFEGKHIISLKKEQGTDALELTITRGRIAAHIEQHQMKSYPATKLISSRLASIVEKAAQGLAEVVKATGTHVSEVVLHVWYYGEPVVYSVEALHAYGEQYRSHFATAVRGGVRSPLDTEAPRATVKLHQYQEVLDIVHPEFKTQLLPRVPVSWTV